MHSGPMISNGPKLTVVEDERINIRRKIDRVGKKFPLHIDNDQLIALAAAWRRVPGQSEDERSCKSNPSVLGGRSCTCERNRSFRWYSNVTVECFRAHRRRKMA